MPIQGDAVVWTMVANMKPLQAGLTLSQRRFKTFAANVAAKTKAMGLGFTALGATMAIAFGSMVKKAMDFEQAIANAASVTGDTGEELENTKKKLEELAAELGIVTRYTQTEVATAFYDLGSKGFKVAAMEAEHLKGILDIAAGTQSDLAFATETVTSTLRGFGLENKDITRIADVFAKSITTSALTMEKLNYAMPVVSATAKELGMSFEDTVASLAALAQSGVKMETAATGMRNVMVDLTKGTPGLRAVLDKLGLTMDDVDVRVYGLNGALKNMKRAGASSQDMIESFGKKTLTTALALAGATKTNDKYSKSLLKVNGAAKKLADQQLDTLGGQFTILKSAIEAVVIPIGKALIPILRELLAAAIPIVRGWAKWIQQNPELTGQIVKIVAGIGALMFVVGPLLLALPLIGAAFAALLSPLGLVAAFIGYEMVKHWDSFKQAIVDTKDWFIDNWDEIKESFDATEESIGNTWDAVMAMFGTAWEYIRPIFEGFKKALFGIGKDATELENFANGANVEDSGSWIEELTKTIKSVNEELKLAVAQWTDWRLQAESASGWWTTFWSDFATGVKKTIYEVGDVFTRIFEMFTFNTSDMADRLIAKIRAVIDWIRAAIGSMSIDMNSPFLGTYLGDMVSSDPQAPTVDNSLANTPATGAGSYAADYAAAAGGGAGSTINLTVMGNVTDPTKTAIEVRKAFRDEMHRTGGLNPAYG